jgi:hypothetical protein
VAFLLLGAAAVVSRLVPRWLGALLVLGGLLSLALGFSVSYEGLESGFQDLVGIALQIVVLSSRSAFMSSAAEDENRAPARLPRS